MAGPWLRYRGHLDNIIKALCRDFRRTWHEKENNRIASLSTRQLHDFSVLSLDPSAGPVDLGAVSARAPFPEHGRADRARGWRRVPRRRGSGAVRGQGQEPAEPPEQLLRAPGPDGQPYRPDAGRGH